VKGLKYDFIEKNHGWIHKHIKLCIELLTGLVYIFWVHNMLYINRTETKYSKEITNLSYIKCIILANIL